MGSFNIPCSSILHRFLCAPCQLYCNAMGMEICLTQFILKVLRTAYAQYLDCRLYSRRFFQRRHQERTVGLEGLEKTSNTECISHFKLMEAIETSCHLLSLNKIVFAVCRPMCPRLQTGTLYRLKQFHLAIPYIVFLVLQSSGKKCSIRTRLARDRNSLRQIS